MRPPRAAFLALLCASLVGLVAAGCGADNDTVTVTATTPAPDRTASEESAPTKPEPDPEIVSLTGFQSPSGNIGCVLGDDGVRCDIAERDWEPPPKPDRCELDWGQGLQASDKQDRASVVCAGDTALDPGAEVLPYGDVARAGDFTCTSAKSGISCFDDGDGYGFFISKQSYRLYNS